MEFTECLHGHCCLTQAKLESSLAKVGTVLREVDTLRNQGDERVHKEVGGVQELVQKGLLQLKQEAENQKGQVHTPPLPVIHTPLQVWRTLP
jgi:hypothetical protein